MDSVAASCAAPFYFAPIRIKNSYLQDGGLVLPNPFEEIPAHIPPTNSQSSPIDFILSLGTGTSVRASSLIARYPYRLYQTFSDQLDGQKHWERRAPMHPSQTMYRICPVYQGSEIALDDVSALDRLETLTRRYLDDDRAIRKTIHDVYVALICSAFYIQLDGEPKFDPERSCYVCRSSVLLRWQEDQAICDQFRRRLRGATMVLPHRAVPLTIPLTTDLCIASLEDPFSIILKFADGGGEVISGMPTSVASIRRLQGGLPTRTIKRHFLK